MKNVALFTDFYELSMAQGFFLEDKNPKAVFEYFFRNNPFNNGYTVFAGLGSLLEKLKNFKFESAEIKYLKNLNYFKVEFLDYLENLKLNLKIKSIDEARLSFPLEPILKIEGSLIEILIIEGLILNTLNFESLIATKTARVKEAGAKILSEFGLRRAQGSDGALSASRAAYIGGADSTSNVLAGFKYNIPVSGTMAHSWVMSFKDEQEAFKAYSKIYPKKTTLLIDTYDVLGSGIKEAIKVFKDLKKDGESDFAIRIDSGDLEYLSKKVREELDKNDLKECKIIVSNELDEEIILYLKSAGSPIDIWGVGTNLVTAKDSPALSGVYKMCAIEENGKWLAKMKISNNIEKSTLPSQKEIVRIYKNSQMIVDLIYLKEEEEELLKTLREKKKITIYHPIQDFNFKTLKDYDDFEVLLKERDYSQESLKEIRENLKKDLSRIDKTYKRIINPHIYKVSITEKLKNLKNNLILNYKSKNL